MTTSETQWINSLMNRITLLEKQVALLQIKTNNVEETK